LAFLKGLKIWGTFGKGWSRRVSEVRSLALSMAANPSTAYTPKPSVPELLAEEAKQPVKVEPVKVHWLTALIAAIARLIGKQ
jgi:lysozyme family protein